jgi:hypothetical protein
MFKFVEKLKEEKVKKETLKKEDKFSRVQGLFNVKDSFNGDFDYFLENFRDKSLVMLIIGKRGGGKTALGMKFVEIGKILDKKSYVIGFENSKTPKWVRKVNNLEDVPNNSLVLVDEAGISFSARESMKKANKEMANLLSIARHKNLSLIFITQNCMSLRTKVITEKSIKTLKDLNNKDKVLSYNFKEDKLEFKKTIVSPIKNKELIKIETEDGDIIECSPEHKLLVKKDKKIIKKRAKDITNKDYLFKPLKKK